MRWCKGREAALSRPRASPGVLCPLSRGADPNASTAFLGAPLLWHSPLRIGTFGCSGRGGHRYCRWGWLHASAATLPGGLRPLWGRSGAAPGHALQNKTLAQEINVSATYQQEQGGHISPQRLCAHMDLCSPPPPPPLPEHRSQGHEACPRKGRVQDQPHRAGSAWGRAGGKTLSQAHSLTALRLFPHLNEDS